MTAILGTGGAGYIGSHTCKALRRAGFSPIAYDNLSRGNEEAVQWGALENGAFNLGTGGWSVRELIDTDSDIAKRPLPVQIGPRRPGDPPCLVADASRARKRLGWRPRFANIATQVAHAWAWRQGVGRSWKRMQATP